jgi:hypothetical protein
MWPFKGCEDGVHKFEARYDLSEPKFGEIPWSGMKSFSMAPTVVEKMRRRIYVRDVCVRCGKVIERDD